MKKIPHNTFVFARFGEKQNKTNKQINKQTNKTKQINKTKQKTPPLS